MAKYRDTKDITSDDDNFEDTDSEANGPASEFDKFDDHAQESWNTDFQARFNNDETTVTPATHVAVDQDPVDVDPHARIRELKAGRRHDKKRISDLEDKIKRLEGDKPVNQEYAKFINKRRRLA
jgi:hypothetical protein